MSNWQEKNFTDQFYVKSTQARARVIWKEETCIQKFFAKICLQVFLIDNCYGHSLPFMFIILIDTVIKTQKEHFQIVSKKPSTKNGTFWVTSQSVRIDFSKYNQLSLLFVTLKNLTVRSCCWIHHLLISLNMEKLSSCPSRSLILTEKHLCFLTVYYILTEEKNNHYQSATNLMTNNRDLSAQNTDVIIA